MITIYTPEKEELQDVLSKKKPPLSSNLINSDINTPYGVIVNNNNHFIGWIEGNYVYLIVPNITYAYVLSVNIGTTQWGGGSYYN